MKVQTVSRNAYPQPVGTQRVFGWRLSLLAAALAACSDGSTASQAATCGPTASVACASAPQAATGGSTATGTAGVASPPGVGVSTPPLDAGTRDAGTNQAGGSAGTNATPTAGAGNAGASGGGATDAATSDDDAGSVSDSGVKPPEPTPTCSQATAIRAGETTRMIKVGDVMRSYLLHVPAKYANDKPVPLVFDWHGLLLDGPTERQLSGYAELADQEGFIVAFPNGIDSAWNVGPCCTTSRTVDDVAFARALVTEIRSLACIDPKRVYSVGFSMGGGMSHLLACNAADVFAAVAPAAFDLLVEDEEPCHPSRPITVISFRGSDDFIVPYAGGASNPPNGLPVTIHFRGARATFDHWKTLNRCTGSPAKSGNCETYASCAEGVETTLCTEPGGSHAPGDPKLGWATLKRFTLP